MRVDDAVNLLRARSMETVSVALAVDTVLAALAREQARHADALAAAREHRRGPDIVLRRVRTILERDPA